MKQFYCLDPRFRGGDDPYLNRIAANSGILFQREGMTMNDWLRNFWVLAMGLILLTVGRAWAGNELSPQKVKAMVDQKEKIILVDVRTPEEYVGELGHIEGAVLKPLPQIDEWFKEFEGKKKQAIVFVCRSGRRSFSAASYFREHQVEKAYSLTGGMSEWNRLGYPVVKNPPEEKKPQ
jgi:rhodanese-related sulfurtransferase